MTREELARLFQHYPPSVRRVFQLDPSLLTNAAYLETYPELAEYLGQHPEVARNPVFFLGEFEQQQVFNEDASVRLWREVFENIAIFVVVSSIVGGFIFGVRTVIDHRRWLRVSKIQTEAHTKLLDRFTASDELLAYIKTPAGRRFLESAPIPVGGPSPVSPPINRIMWSVQLGVVLAALGIGLQFVGMRITDRISEMFYFLGVVGIALGLGFIVSAIASYLIAQRLGLFDKALNTGNDTTPETSSS